MRNIELTRLLTERISMTTPTAPESSLYIFPSDLLDEGVNAVQERARTLGACTLTVAMAYHQARDVTPHAGAKPRLRFRKDGVFFRPDESRWHSTPLRPRIQDQSELDAVQGLLDSSDSDLRVEAWTVFLHNMSLGEDHPALASRTCFGDLLLSNICPLNPDAAEYAIALADDISSRGLDIVAEALSGQTFAHGHHHERSFAPVGELAEAILGLCFCSSCAAAAEARNVDVERLAAAARDLVQDSYGGAAHAPATREALGEALGSDVIEHLTARESGVADLTARVADVVRANGRRLSFMDLTGAVLGYGDGNPTGAPAAEQAWRLAIDPASAAHASDSYSILGYANDPSRLEVDVASYRESIGDTPLRVILRPGYPDSDSPEHLARKVEACIDGGADQVDFYNYGMYDEHVLARIPYALNASR